MPFTVVAVLGKSPPNAARKTRELSVARSRSKPIQGRSPPQQGVLNVKFSIAWAALAAGTLQICFAASLFAQDRTPPAGAGAGAATPKSPVRASGTNVAVLDTALVFEHNPAFVKEMGELKATVEEFDGYLRAEQAKLAKYREQSQEFQPGSPEFKKLEEDFARGTANLNIKMQQHKREILEKESQIYYTHYKDLLEVVATLAERNDIKLVLRFNSQNVKGEDRASVMEAVNRGVIYQRNLNITNLVIKALGGDPNSTPPSAKPDVKGETARGKGKTEQR
jgi:Skp family chaperone for outer membrane proteins